MVRCIYSEDVLIDPSIDSVESCKYAVVANARDVIRLLLKGNRALDHQVATVHVKQHPDLEEWL